MAEQAATNPCTQSAEALVSRMLDAAAYPHPAADLQMIETHLSWVFLAGEFAYKVRKPVKLDFVEFFDAPCAANRLRGGMPPQPPPRPCAIPWRRADFERSGHGGHPRQWAGHAR